MRTLIPECLYASRLTLPSESHDVGSALRHKEQHQAACQYVQQVLKRKGTNKAFLDNDGSLQPWLASAQEDKSAAKPLSVVLKQAGKRALGGGLPGAAAMGIQVGSLMWLRTTVNYQYRYGTTTTDALKKLYAEGGIVRFYRGTTMQVEGKGGFAKLATKVRTNGFTVLYHGSLAAWAATFVGHWPWFAVYNTLNEKLPQYDDLPKRLLRSAIIGFSASAVSDTCSNSIRVIKTTKQTHSEAVTYPQVLKEVLAKDGVLGLMGRGLKTKILANGLQGLLFTVLWRLGQDMWNKHMGEDDK
ncbi:hypothetical protein WJX73_004001 [Symbiochloris irregularis]|uniref:Mitochondrial carrier protein n=1 Tax=Symbiochloris irregularis TaxID=706552 RepID=A0AAW1NMV8_9CHLO